MAAERAELKRRWKASTDSGPFWIVEESRHMASCSLLVVVKR